MAGYNQPWSMAGNGIEFFSKVLQRVLNMIKHGSGQMPIQCCRCQLGFSDATDWATVGDHCQDSLSTVHDLLNHACKCGRMTFRHKSGANGFQIPEEHWKSATVHMLKDELIQSFIGGKIEHLVEGCMEPAVNDPPNGRWPKDSAPR